MRSHRRNHTEKRRESVNSLLQLDGHGDATRPRRERDVELLPLTGEEITELDRGRSRGHAMRRRFAFELVSRELVGRIPFEDNALRDLEWSSSRSYDRARCHAT